MRTIFQVVYRRISHFARREISRVYGPSRSILPMNVQLLSHLNLLLLLHPSSTCKARSHACDGEVHSSKRPVNGPAQKRRFR